MKTISLLLLLFLFSNILLGQKNDRLFIQDSIKAVQYLNIADQSWREVDTCMKYTYLAMPLLLETNQWEKYISCLAGLSYCYDEKEMYDSLESNNYRAFQLAKIYLEPNNDFYSFTANNLGYFYLNVRQDYKQALELFNTALEVYDTSRIHIIAKGTFYKNLGEVHLRKGDYQQSIINFQKALSNFELVYELKISKLTKAYYKIVEVYKSLANLYQYQKDYDKVIFYLKKMTDLIAKNPEHFTSKYFVYTNTQLAEVLLEQKKLDQALFYIEKAANYKKLNTQQQIEINRLYTILYLYSGQLNQAESFSKKALKYTPRNQPITLSKILHLKGQIFSQQNKYTKAIETYQQGIQQLIPNDSFSIQTSTLQSNLKILSRLDLIDHLQAMGKTLNDYYLEKKDNSFLKQSLNCFLLISQLSDQLREDYQSDESKIFLNKKTHQFYEEGIATAFQLFEITQDSSFLNHAFYFFEKSKSVVLLDELKAKEAAGIFTIPTELADKQYQLRADINYLKRKIETAKQKGKDNTQNVKSWNSELFELTQQQAQIKETIKEEYPDYVALTKGEIPSVFSIQKNLCTPHSALIEYFIGKSNSYVFFISQQSIELKKIAKSKVINDWVKELTNDMKLDQQNSLERFTKVSHSLYQELIGDFNLADINDLTIIPDDSLSYLPFDILLLNLPTTDNPRQFEYLVKTHNIGYAYSASLFQLQQSNLNTNGKVLTIAPVFKNQITKHLRNSDSEINAFKKVNHTLLKHQDATKDSFLKQVSDFGLLYFSTHATSKDTLNQQPAIEFIDEQFYLSNLYSLKLPTHLAVLSACETGVGDNETGEGVMSLARGFTYAGVPSVVTTLWKVNESSTNLLVQDFFKNLTQGKTKDKALRMAKINYLATCEDIKSSPYYWAGFVLIGNTQPFIFEKKTSSKWVIISGTLLILFLMIIRRKNI